MRGKWFWLVIFVCFVSTGVASAAPITLVQIASFPKSAPFGLAYDGTNMWYSTGGSTASKFNSTTGADIGATISINWSELGWDPLVNGGSLVTAAGSQVQWRNPATGAVTQTLTLSGVSGGLIDGLDVNGNEIWLSPDVGPVYRRDRVTGAVIGSPNPFLPSQISGVERVDVGLNSYVLVVNDAANPRQLCIYDLGAVQIGCQDFVNQRYEGLGFDGRYLFAADYYGNKIDKFDVLVDNVPIFVPPDAAAVPDPASLTLHGMGLAGLVARHRRRRR